MPTRPKTFRPAGSPQGERKAWERPAEQGRVQRLTGRKGVALRTLVRTEEPLCRRCLAEGRVSATTEVDHIVPLAWGGTNDRGNLQGLCYDCHDAKSQAEKRGARTMASSPEFAQRRMPSDLKPSQVPLSMVCGPPGSGKSTFVRGAAGPRDIVIDLDQILSEISGQPEHRADVQWLGRALDERNERLRALASARAEDHPKAWFIISVPDPSERAVWAQRLGAEAIVMATPLAECVRRILADPARRGRTARMIDLAATWWAANPHLTPDEPGGEGG